MATHIHHIDHIAPVCELMGVPLLVPNTSYGDVARTCYPNLAVKVDQPWLRRGAFEGKVVYYSDIYPRDALRYLFGGSYPARQVFCPHGFSEKRQRWSADAVLQDVFLVHGQYALDQLKEWGVFEQAERYVVTGNLRYRYYQRHREFFDSVADRLLTGLRPNHPTILYAPTWNDNIGSSSFFDMARILVNALPAEYNLVIKAHPLLERSAELLNALLASINGRSGVVLARNLPLTYPLLARADIYVGDMSALAYDFLVFDRPMFFLNQTSEGPADAGGSRLFACGVVIDRGAYGTVYHLIENHCRFRDVHTEQRRALWSYVHDERRTDADVARDLAAAVSGPAPLWMLERESAEAETGGLSNRPSPA